MTVTCNQCKCPCSDDTRKKFNFNGCDHFISISNPVYDNLRKALEEKDAEIIRLQDSCRGKKWNELKKR